MKRTYQSGETLIGFLSAVLITSLMLAGAVTALAGYSKATVDHRFISEANDTARTVADLMSFELRFAGSGIPFQQNNFLMTNLALNGAPLPILTSATATSITFRMNSKGVMGFSTAQFNPASQNTISIVSNPGIVAGDTIYLSDLPAGGTYGLQGTVQSVTSTTVTLNAGSTYTAGALFGAGSSIEPVQTITYTSSTNGIRRTVGSQITTLSSNGSFTLQYLNTAGAALALPLTEANIASSLASLDLTISIPSTRNLSSGAAYTASLPTRIALRELNVYR